MSFSQVTKVEKRKPRKSFFSSFRGLFLETNELFTNTSICFSHTSHLLFRTDRVKCHEIGDASIQVRPDSSSPYLLKKVCPQGELIPGPPTMKVSTLPLSYLELVRIEGSESLL